MKKVLIITYYWPPAGGPGVQRWLKFVKYLPEFGIEPVVYVPENPAYPIVDKELIAEIPPETTIVKRPIFEPYGLASIIRGGKINTMSAGIIPPPSKQTFVQKLALWIRGNLFIPDARVFWVRPSVKFLKKYIADNGIDTIITSGPPHSLHLIGLQLKKVCAVTWMADFRDPWTSIGYHEKLRLSAFARRKHEKLERMVVQAADRVLVTSKSTRDLYVGITDGPIDIITNGYDVAVNSDTPSDEKFSLVHIGSMLTDRNPEVLWRALAELASEDRQFANDLEIKFVGTTAAEVIVSAKAFGLEKNIAVLGYVPHREAILQQRNSQVLLLVEIDTPETRCILPGKLFEYMASGRPIVGIGPEHSDFAGILEETQTGRFFTYRQKDALKLEIKRLYEIFKSGGLAAHPVNIEKYSRRNLAGELAKLIAK